MNEPRECCERCARGWNGETMGCDDKNCTCHKTSMEDKDRLYYELESYADGYTAGRRDAEGEKATEFATLRKEIEQIIQEDRFAGAPNALNRVLALLPETT